METIDIIAAAVLIMVVVVGVAIKRYTKRSLKDIDGLGQVSTEKESKDVVAKF